LPLFEGFLMANELKGKKVAFLATDMVEQVELTGPWQALKDAGASTTVSSRVAGPTTPMPSTGS